MLGSFERFIGILIEHYAGDMPLWLAPQQVIQLLHVASKTLMRLRATESQAGLTFRQRRLNVRGAFTVSDAAIVAGKHVLLIDDILTTGATARAAAQALLLAGAESVWVATLARAASANPNRRDSDLYIEDAEDEQGNAPPAILPSGSVRSPNEYSSHDQPSF